jgi:guanosine-3',5'-bis(diphosphate) 3'-pyrophosphohydrolase
MNEMLRAANFAADKHRDQRRKDRFKTPYINHPLAVANILASEVIGVSREAILAGLLHDTIEDTNTTEIELRWLFGDIVTSIVLEVSDDKTLPKAVRKQLQIHKASMCSIDAKHVKLADKIANLRDMAESHPDDWPIDRVIEYFDWAKKVVDQIRGTHAQLEALFDDIYAKKPGHPSVEFGF